jgi:hypothetical protein
MQPQEQNDPQNYQPAVVRLTLRQSFSWAHQLFDKKDLLTPASIYRRNQQTPESEDRIGSLTYTLYFILKFHPQIQELIMKRFIGF